MAHKAGFINILGNPNVGKSTIMNALTGEKLSIITSKVQTTRHRIMGFVNGEDFQLVFSDTPGLLKPRYKLQEAMAHFANLALVDADILLYVTEVNEKEPIQEEIKTKLNKAEFPVLVVLNKIDLANEDAVKEQISEWEKLIPGAFIIPVSALRKFNLEALWNKIIELLPEHPPYFPKDEITDKPTRFFVSEIIREKILKYYQKEIPYSVEIVIESYQESPEIDRIRAIIYCARDSQKSILIGQGGKAMKKTGTAARIDIEDFLGKKVYLELFVKIKKDWRDNDKLLKQFGY
ncbi:MAG: GTPase Era [bacterium]